jgi:hypothetical protein
MSKKQEPVKPTVNTGNASNPSPGNETANKGMGLLDPKAEKYLRESGNIEDMPDAEEDQEAIDQMEKEKNEKKED